LLFYSWVYKRKNAAREPPVGVNYKISRNLQVFLP
jgi:hypothetical protein